MKYLIGIVSAIIFATICPAEVAVFVPSGGKHFGGELLRNSSESTDLVLSRLEAEAASKGGMLTRREIIKLIAECPVELNHLELSHVDFAIRVVQRSKFKTEKIFSAFQSTLNSVSSVSGETIIRSGDIRNAPVSDDLELPKESTYRWCVSDSGNHSILLHQSGERWFELPLKSVLARGMATIAPHRGDSKVQSVYQFAETRPHYVYPEWHPLLSSRFVPEIRPIGVLWPHHEEKLSSGNRFFEGYLFSELETIQGKECVVYGGLGNAIYIEAEDMHKILVEIHGYLTLEHLHKIEHNLLPADMSVVRINSEFKKIAGNLFIPCKTEIQISDNERLKILYSTNTHNLSQECSVDSSFENFKPYVLIQDDAD